MKRAERRRWKAWNEAIVRVAHAVDREAGRMRLQDRQRVRLLEAVRSLRHPTIPLRHVTNEELARKWGISRRCVQYWRRAGCPFSDRRASVLEWMLKRGRLPRRCGERFAEELRALSSKLLNRQARALVTLERVQRRTSLANVATLAGHGMERLAGEIASLAVTSRGG